MNVETAGKTLALEPGAAVLYDEPLKLSALRDDLVFLRRALRQDHWRRSVTMPSCGARQEHDLRSAGEASRDRSRGDGACPPRRQLGKKTKAIELNLAALEAGFAFAGEHLVKRIRI
jgi:2-oxoglutarate ferredoxin oxidoreductase subunit alpha